MATHPGPRPKRKDYASKIFFEIALSTWETMKGLYQYDREREYEQRQAQRQRERQERAAQARKSRRQQAGKVAGAIIGGVMTAHGLNGAIHSPGLAAGVFPGREEDATTSMMYVADVRAHEERDRRSQDMDEGTRDAGYSSGYDSLY